MNNKEFNKEINKEFKTVLQKGYAVYEEKKSEFIANVFPVKTEEEALSFLNEMKKQYKDARHNCFAYIIMENGVLKERYSDDGEPSGTAGMPILEVIRREELQNLLVVVTRYFGGTLLGTGGLVRAYGKSAKDGVLNAKIIEKLVYKKFVYEVSYETSGKLQFAIIQNNGIIAETEYGENVVFNVFVKACDEKNLTDEVLEITNGKADTNPVESCYGALVDGEIKIFEN